MQGPWKPGVRARATSSRFTPAELYRTGIAAANAFLREDLRQELSTRSARASAKEFLVGLRAGKVAFENGPVRAGFLATVYQTVMEGMFAEPDLRRQPQTRRGWK